ncbi:hypothetical protein D3C75_1290140 [compost metagenome]
MLRAAESTLCTRPTPLVRRLVENWTILRRIPSFLSRSTVILGCTVFSGTVNRIVGS